MDADIAVLKYRADQADARMGRVEDKLDRVIELLGTRASRQDVWTALGTGAAIAFAVIAIFVGVLAYLQDQRIANRSDPPTATPPAAVVAPVPSAPAVAPAPAPVAPVPRQP